MERDDRRLAICLVAFSFAACSADGVCTGPSVGWLSRPFVGVFDAAGAPLCTADAEVVIRQGRRTQRLVRLDGYAAVYSPHTRGEHLAILSGVPTCNLYAEEGIFDPTVVPPPQWPPCEDVAPPFEYYVRVPGCPPSGGVWTWSSNFGDDSHDASWRVPALVECGASPPDASVPEDP